MDHAASPREPPRDVRVIAVTSGKGGVGKTNVTSNLATLAAQAGERVLIIDGDLGVASVEVLLGLTPRYHLGHLLDGTATLDQVLARGPGGVRVLPGGGARSLTVLEDAQKLRLVTALDEVENDFDLVLIDTSTGIGDNVLFFVGGAQEALLVVNPEPTALTAACAVVKALSAEGGVERFDVVVNPVPSEQLAREVYEKLCDGTQRVLKARLKLLGFIPHDENVHGAVLMQTPVVLAFPGSPASLALHAIARKLLSEPPSRQSGGLKFLWHRLHREQPGAVSQPALR